MPPIYLKGVNMETEFLDIIALYSAILTAMNYEENTTTDKKVDCILKNQEVLNNKLNLILEKLEVK